MNLWNKSANQHTNASLRIHLDKKDAENRIANALLTQLLSTRERPVVIVCIGTDRSTGDALGPLVGTLLTERNIPCFHVYGTLDQPIHAVNLEEKLAYIEETYEHPFIIAIDASLGLMKNIGVIQVGNGPVKPGAGVEKKLPHVGDIHITAIVNMSGYMSFVILQNTRLGFVMRLARIISDSLHQVSLSYHRRQLLLQRNQEISQDKSL